jgi:glyoxylase-like metal-dependent hydrolase (beta-lactamase superfamily II)
MATVERVRLAYNNVYLVREGGRLVVVDTGPDYRGARGILFAALDGAIPDVVVATHGHLDHAGLGAWWQSIGVPVLVGTDDAVTTRGEGDDDFDHMERYARSVGAPATVEIDAVEGLRLRRRAVQAMRAPGDWPTVREGRWPTGLRYELFHPSRTVEGRTELACGLSVIHSPGHTPGNLVVVHEGEEWLFSGDQLLPEITPTPAIQFVSGERFASLPRFVDSLRLLQERQPSYRICFPGHGEPFEHPETVIAATLEQAEQRSNRLLESLRTEGPGTVYSVAERLYPRAWRRRFWPIIATVQGHLDLLSEAGLARCESKLWTA